MALEFDIGDPASPRGHAIIYFRARYDAEKLLATYAITLPMAIDFSKYVPPFLASHLAAEPLKDLSAFSLPPVPEEVVSYDYIRHLSESRSDDLVCGGTVASNDLPEMMQMAGDAVQEYARLWKESQPDPSTPAIADSAGESSDGSFSVNEVLYGLMNESDRLQELTKLVGKLRFALDGNDGALREEACEEIAAVGRHMPDNYQVSNLLKAMLGTDTTRAAVLTQLYLDRCYKLLEGDDNSVLELEERIRGMEASS